MDPYQYRAVWGVPVPDRRSFDLLVARQLVWLPHARPAVRRLLFTDDEQPVCPVCQRPVGTGDPSVVCAAVLADPPLQQRLRADPAAFISRPPDSHEAWWLVHGDCFDQLDPARIAELDRRVELALRADARAN